MRHTLKAVFDNRSDAQHVLEELLASGYTHAEVALADDTGEAASAEHHEGLAASVRHAFGKLFGSKHHDDPAPSSREAAHGHHVVMFTTESEPEAERAAGIIGRFGPAGIEESHEQSDRFSADTYLPGVAALSSAYPPGTEPGSLQYRMLDDGRYFGTQNATSPPHGDTFQDSMGAGSTWAHPDEKAAYHYGKDMGASEAYRDSSWDEAEPSLKIGWMRRYPRGESPAWHRIKEAVRQGWDFVRARMPGRKH
jgi:hypothetical protein